MPDYSVGDPWPDGLDAKLNAQPGLLCPCGGFVETGYDHCETCGRAFDDRGNRVVCQGDLDDRDDDGQLEPDPDPDYIR